MTTSQTFEPTSSFNAAEAASDNFGTNVGELAEQWESFVLVSWTSRLGCNVGRTEQKLRIGFGTALLAAAALAPLSRGWRIGLAAAGAAELLTGAIRYCPVSHVLGVNTCRGDER